MSPTDIQTPARNAVVLSSIRVDVDAWTLHQILTLCAMSINKSIIPLMRSIRVDVDAWNLH